MKRGHLIFAVIVAVIVIIVASTIFTANNQAPEVDGSQTADSPAEQQDLPAGPATEPAETTGN
ncbi:hypothetical protein [Devosia sediminis]|uniref:Uncharacterized protein n=1 Tax=Devosia sediminis TaxID=2798801 RepID=A0A934IUE7_9HYPH|nr:hypothetical protein [Devosia sediminis]MBJ3785331.1 hypothetical protein [Devosia sediminis]